MAYDLVLTKDWNRRIECREIAEGDKRQNVTS